MNKTHSICAGVLILTGSLWAQVQSGPSQNSDLMLTPPPVSGQAFDTEATSEERSNFWRGGINFTSAYSDNALGDVNGHPESDVSYSVMPMLGWDKTTTRLHWLLNYAPGFTFYQHESSRDEADQNASLNLQYRLSPHVTLSAGDSFQKSSNAFNQPDLTSGTTVTGGTQPPNFSIIAPIADRLTNSGNVGISYQFGLNSMIGASGNFSNLHYPNASEVPGLYDSSTQGGTVFLSLRASRMHYFGASYQYQRLVSFPFGVSDETQTHAAMFFYSLYPTRQFSISVFGGPQYSDSAATALPGETATPETRAWTPAAGASMAWSGDRTSFAISYSHVISSGAGLGGAVHMDSASAAIRQVIRKSLMASITGSYANNKVLADSLPFTNYGHTIQGSATLEQQLGQNVSLTLGYTRLHQSYSNVPVIAQTPDTNREMVSLSYSFTRALGR
ncbi:MAG TPA: hypothetical protein VMB19_09110 [Silvibacterium sp.]|nr:hypothetical protein [Silvibacterium sp.]